MKTIVMPAWSFYPAQEGGPSNALYWLASGLARIGYNMRVITTDRYIPENSVPINKWHKLNGFDVIYQSLDQSDILIYNEVDNCDILFTDGVCKLDYFRLVKKALSHKKIVVLSPRGELFDSALDHKGKLYGTLKRGFLFLIKQRFGKRIWFHATSMAELNAIYKHFGRKAKAELIPNYMILPEVHKDALLDVQRDYLLYIGRINHIKNLHILIKGLSKSKYFMNGNMVLKIAGDAKGEYYESLLSLIENLNMQNKVQFLGVVVGEEKNRLYAGAKCTYLISKSENFGNVVIESIRQGTPVIASQGTPWQSLNERLAGNWIDATEDNVSFVTDHMLSIDQDSYMRMRHNAYDYSLTFDIYSNLDKWSYFINKITE